MKLLLILLGATLLVNAVCATVLSNFSTGVLLIYVLGAMLVLCGTMIAHLHKAVPLTLLGGCLVLALVISGLYAYGKADNATCQEDAVIVLGAGIRGDKPSKSLQNRLDCAIAYHAKNPTALIVVSGGQGPQETVTEAYAMEQYLLENGVSASCILKEEAATSTAENFRYSKAMLDDRFQAPYSVAFITTDYHIFRAVHTAQRFGFKNATHCHSGTPWYTILPNGIRECLAVCKFWIIKQEAL